MSQIKVVAGQTYTLSQLIGDYTPTNPNIVGVALEITADPSEFTVVGGPEIPANPPYYFFNLYSTGPATNYFNTVYANYVNYPSAEIQISPTATYLDLYGYIGDVPASFFPNGNGQFFVSWALTLSVQAPDPLFTTGAETVDFNDLTSDQQSKIAGGADIYHGLGGNDVVTLPDLSNYNESVGNVQTLDWTNTAASTFYTGSLAGNTYHVVGLDGSYFIVEGAGTEFVTINGNGNSNITAGAGSDTITIYGNGDNTIGAGGGKDTITIIGTGNNAITAGSGPDPDIVTISGTGSNTVTGKLTGSISVFEGGTVELKGGFAGSATIGGGSTLQLDGVSTGSGGIVFRSNGLEELTIRGKTMPTNLISGFTRGDIIDLASIPFDSAGGVTLLDSSAHVLDIFENGQNYQLDFAASQKLNSTATDDFSLTSDGKDGTDLTFATNWGGSSPSLAGKWSPSPGQASLQNLADLANDVYGSSLFDDGFDRDVSLGYKFSTLTENQEFTYVNADDSQVVISISGTFLGHGNRLAGLKNLTTDIASFPTGVPTPGLLIAVEDAYNLLAEAHTAFPKAHITLTGHSLGGAIAQLVGETAGYDTVTFNAPGAEQLQPALNAALGLAGVLTSVKAIANQDPNYLGEHDNYHIVGDAVSMVPTQIGNMFTIKASTPLAGDATSLADIYTNHLMATVIPELKQNGTTIESGLQEPDGGLNIFSNVVPFAGIIPGVNSILAFSFVANAAGNLFDPSSGSIFQFAEVGASDPITAVTFLEDPGIAYFEVETLSNGSLAAPITVSAGVTTDLPSDTTGFQFEAFSSAGQAVSLPDGYLFDATFASSTQVSATLLNLTGNVISAGSSSAPHKIQSGSTLIVSEGDLTSGALVSGGKEYVYAGGTSISSTVTARGMETVWFGGTASDTTVQSGGHVDVGSGGVASTTTIKGGGTQIVEDGGTASDAEVLGGGTLSVLSGGLADPTIVHSGGTEVVSAGGEDDGALISGGIQLDYGFARGATVFAGLQIVEPGGSVSGTTVSSGGSEIVSGTDDGANISGGRQLDYGVASGATVFTGSQVVEAGGAASSTTVSSGGTETVLSGGMALGATIVAGGTLIVSSGGLFEFTSDTTGMPIVRAGATLEIGSGYAFSGTIGNGIKLEILSGGTDIGAIVSSGGKEIVLAGGSAGDTTVLKGGVETVSSGGSASGTMVSSGGTVDVLSGDTAFESATVFRGGKLNVSKGGTAHDIAVSSGGALNVAGTVTSDVAVLSGGVETVSSGGLVSGSSVARTAISGGTVNVLSGGTFGFAEVSSGGKLNLSKGGTAHDITVSSGGALNVAGATTGDVVVASGGVETVSSGGVVSGPPGSGTTVFGTVNVLAGGTANELFVSSGGALNVHGKVASGVTVFAGGIETVSSGGLVSGSSVADTTISGGMVDVLAGGRLTFATVSSGGELNIAKGGSGARIVVSNAGNLNVSGTIISSVTVLGGGTETVSSGGVASGTSVSGTVISGGEVDVLAGGKLTFATVSSGGELNISKGGAAASIVVSSGGALDVAGTISNVTVSSGGTETVLSGGIASGTTIAGGTLEITSGGSTGGKVTFAAGTNSGTLQLDSTAFSGTVAGMTGQDTIDLRNFNFATAQVTSSVTATSATLTVSAGGDIAHIILLGNYMASTFTASNDGFGGTSIVDPHVSAAQIVPLAQGIGRL